MSTVVLEDNPGGENLKAAFMHLMLKRTHVRTYTINYFYHNFILLLCICVSVTHPASQARV